jgi:hypothetical protein
MPPHTLITGQRERGRERERERERKREREGEREREHSRTLASIKHARTLTILHSVSPGGAINKGREPRSC